MPAPDSALAASDVVLFGKDPMPRLVDVQPLLYGPHEAEGAAVRLYQRSEDFERILTHEERFYPFFLLSDMAVLRGFPRARFRFQELGGDNFFRHLVVFETWGALWDAVHHAERATGSTERRPDQLYFVGSPVQQYLMQTGRTCFQEMTFDDLHRLQLDIETYSEAGFPNAERPEDEIIIIALSDNRGWTRLIEGRGVPEKAMLEELVRVVQAKDPDVIEGHNCFPAGTPVLTPSGYRPIEGLSVGDAVLSLGSDGLERDEVSHTFANDHDEPLVNLRAVYRGNIASTADHPHFGYSRENGVGYFPACTFEVGDYLATPRLQVEDDLQFNERLYLAGLIFADGHLAKQTNRITFGNTDRELVEWVAARLGGLGTIYTRNGNARHAALHRLRTHDPETHAWLQALGIPAGNKSALNAPVRIERIAEEGLSGVASFLAGVIDGDGHVSKPNAHILIACHPHRSKRGLEYLGQHLGLMTSRTKTGIALWPTSSTWATVQRLQSWLRVGHKKSALLNPECRRVDELPYAAIEIVRPFIKKVGLLYREFPLPTTTVNYYLNGRTSIHRATFEKIEKTIETRMTSGLRAEWERAQAQLDELRAFYWSPIRKKSETPFAGTVYNIETGNHNYVASGILTHNCFAFDLDYILKRCRLHGVPFAVGRDGSEPRTFDSSMRFAERTVDFPALEIAGRHVVDTYFQVMAFDVFKRDLPGYGLKAAARYFGFAPEGRTYVEGADIARAWREEPERLLDYALDDVTETERLARHLSGSTFYLTQMLPMTYGPVARTGPASKIESLFVREYLRQRQSVPRSEWGSQSVGGYTDLFITGVVGPVVYADVESLYPSIMLNYDVQPAGDALDLFPGLLRRLTDLRFEAKRQMNAADDAETRSELDARQSSYKVLINCFDPATEIMTLGGPKNVRDVAVGDLVYSINPDTLETEIKPVTHVHEQAAYQGKMVRLKNRHVDFLVTPNHRLLTNRVNGYRETGYQWREASDLFDTKCRHVLPPRSAVQQGRLAETVDLAAHCQRIGLDFKTDGNGRIKELRQQARWIPRTFVLSDWMEFMGWYISEGHLYKSKRKDYGYTVRGETYVIGLNNKTPSHRSDIRALLERMGLSYSEGVNGFTICNKLIYRILRCDCGQYSRNKKIPRWLFTYSAASALPLLEAMYKGDGNQKRFYRYSTNSQQLATDTVQLAHHLGYNAQIIDREGNCYRVGINPPGGRGIAPVVKDEHRTLVDYDGPIHCISVADNHTVLAGRGGVFNWIGQSFYGNLGFSLAAFNDFAEADRVARIGQDLLRKIIKTIRQRGGTVVEVDTDGVLFIPPEGVRGAEEEEAFTVALTDAMPEGIRVGFDGRFRKMLSYKKKNYALLTYDGGLKFKGSSLVARSSERFGRRFVREAIRRLLGEDVQALHDLYVQTRAQIEASDWQSADSFARTETLKDTLDQYRADVESGSRTRTAAYELATQQQKKTGQDVRKGDRISYYVTGHAASVTAFENCKLAADWDKENPDENTAYYLRRLDQFARKFAPFFEEHAFRRIFAPEDLFGFTAEGIALKVHHVKDALAEHEDEVPF